MAVITAEIKAYIAGEITTAQPKSRPKSWQDWGKIVAKIIA
jgi:hypothetical protein